MIHRLLNILGLADGSMNGSAEWRRKHIRHNIRKAPVQADVEINGRLHNVRDWSMGGLSMDAQDSPPAGQVVDMTIRFYLPHETVLVDLPGKVVWVMEHGAAIEFAPLATETRRRLQTVMDGINMLDFLESQVA